MEFEEIRSELLTVADNAMKYARDLNIPSAEAFVYNKSLLDVNEQKGVISSRTGLMQGVGIRVALDKKVGFASCTGFTPSAIKTALSNAHEIAKRSPDTPLFPGFVSTNRRSNEGILDPKLLEVTPNKIISQLDSAVEGIDLVDDRLVGIDIDVSVYWYGYAVATTEGCQQATLYTAHENAVEAILKDQDSRLSYAVYKSGRTIQDITGLAQKAFKKAERSFGKQKFGESVKLPLIFHPRTAATFWGSALSNMLDGAAFIEKRSPLQNKLHKNVAPNFVHLMDDGQDANSLGTNAIDAEGTPMKTTEIIRDGVFNTFLFDHKYGQAAEQETTANAKRESMFGGIPFENSPFIGPNKLIFSLGSKDLEAIIKEYDRAIYIEGYPKGLHTANPLTGDFSLTSNNAFLVENGEIKYPLENISFSGNFIEAFANILEIGSDLVRTGGSMDCPTVVVDKISFSS